MGLVFTVLVQGYVKPALETVPLIPIGLAMADKENTYI
jgi:hypothetical protein